jgi:ribonuclease P protein component
MPARYTFPRAQRLRGRGTFKSIRDSGARESRGPLTLWAVRNGAANSRMGISIGRQVGNAVRRNRIKRLIRESFRLLQRDLPAGYDMVIAVRPHEPLILAEYQRLLSHLMRNAHRKLVPCPPRPPETPG